MDKLKVMTVVGTRPEIIRLSRVMSALDKYMTQVIVHTGQSYDYELNQVFFDDLELRKPDYFLEAAGKSTCETVGMIIAKIDKVLSEVMPDGAHSQKVGHAAIMDAEEIAICFNRFQRPAL